MDFNDDYMCSHEHTEDGICTNCSEIVGISCHNEAIDFSKKKSYRASNKNVTNMFISEVINRVVGKLDATVIQLARDTLEDNTIQIRDELTAKQVVFAHFYSVLYSREVSDDVLFEITPDRLLVIVGLQKDKVSKSLNFINSSRIRGPGIVLIHPCYYLREFKKNCPDSAIASIITDELVEHIKNSIDQEIHLVAMEQPVKIAISYMSLLSEKILKPERGSAKPIEDMYNFYNLRVSKVKDTLPKVRQFFANEFLTNSSK